MGQHAFTMDDPAGIPLRWHEQASYAPLPCLNMLLCAYSHQSVVMQH